MGAFCTITARVSTPEFLPPSPPRPSENLSLIFLVRVITVVKANVLYQQLYAINTTLGDARVRRHITT